MATPAVNEARINAIEDRLERYEENQKEIKSIVSDIHSELSRYKGFMGGVLFVFSAMGAAITLIFKFKAGQ